MKYVLALLLLVFFCVPSQATIVHLGSYTNLELAQKCGANGGVHENGSGGHICTKENCDGKGGTCKVTCDRNDDCYGSTPDKEVRLPGLIDPKTIDSALELPAVVLPMEAVSVARLSALCKNVSGALFRNLGKGYFFCAHADCFHGHICIVECRGLKCTAGLPKKPEAALTLLAILQGGDPVNHSGPALDPTKPIGDVNANNAAPPIIIP